MQNKLRTSVGVILSIALLWVAAACVLSCEELSKERDHMKVTSLTAQFERAKPGADCPFNLFPKAVRSQRLIFQPDAQAHVVVPTLVSLRLIASQRLSFSPDLLREIVDPPRKRLPSLRI